MQMVFVPALWTVSKGVRRVHEFELIVESHRSALSSGEPPWTRSIGLSFGNADLSLCFSAICSNMCLAIYGEYLWQPQDVVDKWMGTHVGRAMGFFCMAAWAIGNIGTVSSRHCI